MEVKKKKKILIRFAIIFASIFVLITIGLIILSAKWKPVLSQKIKEGVYNGSKHLYKIDFKSLNLNVLTGSASLGYVTLIPDSNVLDSLKAINQAPANVLEINLKKLEVKHVGILTAYFKKRIDIKTIILEKPSINVIFNKVKKQENEDKTLYQSISKSLKSIHIKEIKIKDADVDYINKSKVKTTKNSLKHLNISIKDFLLDSLSHQDTTRFYLTKDIIFDIAGYNSITKDKMYKMTIDSISGSIKTKKITISNFKLQPLFKELEFARKYQVQKDRYDLKFNKIEFEDFDFLELSSDQKIYAKALKIGPGNVEVFMSRESPPPPGLDKGQNYPHIALKRLEIPAEINTVSLKNINLKYSEYNPASKKIGYVEFKQLQGDILNVTNDTLALAKNNHALAKFKTLLMGSGNLSVNIDFNLTSPSGAFAYSGSLGNFNLKDLNPLSKSLGLVEIESGNIKQIHFDVKGDWRTAKGSMGMLYNNLKIKLLSDNIDGEGTKKKILLSFLANQLLVKNDNPSKGESARMTQMSNTRINSASFFNLMWKTLFVGIKDIMGVSIVPEKDPVKQQKVIAEKIKAQKKKN
jgi:hypothetical protein